MTVVIRKWLLPALAILLMTGVLMGCAGDDTPTADTGTRVVVAELFTSAECSHCLPAKKTLEALAGDYGLNRVLLLEYVLTGHLSCDDSRARAAEYEFHSIPALFLDGRSGAEGEKSYEEYHEIIDSELLRGAMVALSAARTIAGDIVTVEARVTNTAAANLEDARVVFVLYEDIGEVGNHYLVRNIMTVPLDSLAAAECRDVRVESEALYWCDMARLAVAVFVQDTGGGILQATLAG